LEITVKPAALWTGLTPIRIGARKNCNSVVHLLEIPPTMPLYPSDLKMQDSEPHILVQFKEKNAAE
jgi:hypothetical protein